jgi:hypothetical protein
MKIAISVLCGLLMFGLAMGAMADVIVIDDFNDGLREEWEEKNFQGRTIYTVVTENGNRVLQAESNASASGLIFRVNYDVQEYPILTWRWKVENILEKGDETSKDGDDYAARVYVIFPHWFPPRTRSINYIWANKLPLGEYVPNPFFRNAVMVAVRSGAGEIGRWHTERRNVLEDYRMIFGEDPPDAGAVAIMTDTDNTGESATAFYDDIRLERQRTEEVTP